jgi:hypothetical protein
MKWKMKAKKVIALIIVGLILSTSFFGCAAQEPRKRPTLEEYRRGVCF